MHRRTNWAMHRKGSKRTKHLRPWSPPGSCAGSLLTIRSIHWLTESADATQTLSPIAPVLPVRSLIIPSRKLIARTGDLAPVCLIQKQTTERHWPPRTPLLSWTIPKGQSTLVGTNVMACKPYKFQTLPATEDQKLLNQKWQRGGHSWQVY